jgi:hypothetical protein
VNSAKVWWALLEPEGARCQRRKLRRYFRADAVLANPELRERMKKAEPSEEVSSDLEEKGRWEHGTASEHSASQSKTEGGLGKGLANLWSRKKMKKHENGPCCSQGRNQIGNPTTHC